MLILHQWRQITAYGEDAIIRKANRIRFHRFCYALMAAAEGFQPITTIEEAIEDIQNCENGIVRDEIQVDEITCEE